MIHVMKLRQLVKFEKLDTILGWKSLCILFFFTCMVTAIKTIVFLLSWFLYNQHKKLLAISAFNI